MHCAFNKWQNKKWETSESTPYEIAYLFASGF